MNVMHRRWRYRGVVDIAPSVRRLARAAKNVHQWRRRWCKTRAANLRVAASAFCRDIRGALRRTVAFDIWLCRACCWTAYNKHSFSWRASGE